METRNTLIKTSFFIIWIVNCYKKVFTEIVKLYEKVSEIFVDILIHHAPLKEKRIKGNRALFMTNELSKAIIEKPKTRSIWSGHLEKTTYLTKSLKINVIHWLKKLRKIFFKEFTKDGIMSNKKFWNTVKPF